jgi:gluconolactonase
VKLDRPHFLRVLSSVCLLACLACGGDPSVGGAAAGIVDGSVGSIHRVTAEFDELIPQNYRIERITTGYGFADGPVWVTKGAWEGLPFLFFSDTRGNAIHRWASQGETASEYLQPVFDSGREDGWSIGPAGLAVDAAGNLLICDQGGRRIVRLTSTGEPVTFVDRFEEHRFNSPNDLAWGPDGALYFTDPPFGLRGQDLDPEKDLNYNGVFRVGSDGQNVELIGRGQSRPNGIGFSPDGSALFVSNSDPDRKNWVRYPVSEDGSIGAGRVFYDVTSINEEGLPDGLVLDQAGRLFGTGPGGVWVFSPEGTHLGTIRLAEAPANVAWGNDGRTLYMTARTGVYRIRLNTQGYVQ